MKVKLQNVRLAFNDLFVPTQVNGQGDPKYRATFLLPKGSPAAEEIEAAVKRVVSEKFGATKADAIIASIRSNNMRFNVQDGDLSEYEGFAGNVAVRANAKVKPTVLDRNRLPVSEDSGIIYSGCYVNAVIAFYAYDNQGKGVSASLTGVQFVRDGDAFVGGRPASVDEFEDITEEFDPAFA